MTFTLQPISSLCKRITSGGTPSRNEASYYITPPDGHIWLKSKELLDCSISNSEEHISDNGIRHSAAKYIEEKSVLVAMYGANVGQLGYLKVPATVNQAICGLTTDNSLTDSRWLFYALLNERGRLVSLAQGAAQQNISQVIIKAFELPTPTLPTQRRIASVLSAYDDLIENNTRRIAILEEMARRLYEEWFVQFRFPGHEEAEFEEGLPKGWEMKRLDTVATVNPESISPRQAPETINYIDIASVSPGRVDAVQAMSFEEAPGRARRIVRSGDVIWSCVRPNRRSHALLLAPAPDTIISTGFAVLRAKRVPFSYLYQTVTTDAFVDYLVNHATGAAYPAVKQSDFEAAVILVPARPVLDIFEQAVGSMLRLIHALDAKNANLRAQRDLLLPKLISGEIDVSYLPLPGVEGQAA